LFGFNKRLAKAITLHLKLIVIKKSSMIIQGKLKHIVKAFSALSPLAWTQKQAGRQISIKDLPKICRISMTIFGFAVMGCASVVHSGEPPVVAETSLSPAQKPSNWVFFGDFRNRIESDWNSHRPDGSLRDDRDRYRIRARVGVEWTPAEHWLLRVRTRTGSHFSQQSPHLTLYDFDGGPEDEFDVVFDQWFVQGTFDQLAFWAGRNDFPFFYATESQEMMWHKDVTLTGGFVSWKLSEHFTANAGGFALPEGMDRWNGALWTEQIVAQYKIKESWALKGAASFLDIQGGGASDRLPDGNGARDYYIGILSAQSFWKLEQMPLDYVRLGADGSHNFSNYSSRDADPVTARYHDDTDSFVASLAVGKGKPDARQRWDWEVDYAYGHVEKLAVNASYVQDDWVRWGSNGQTTATDLEGHQIGLRV